MQRHAPTDETEVVERVAAAAAARERLSVRGLGTRTALGERTETDALLDLSALSGVIDYEPAEFVLTALPATPMREVQALLAASGQMLAFEPPDLGILLAGRSAPGTLGGTVATNASGPRRLRLGAPRDHLLGFSAVTGRGEPFRSGGRVVKNVTGFDLSKLVCGSFGTLAVLTRLHLRTWPAPEATVALALRDLAPAAALAALTTAVRSPHDPTGAGSAAGVTAVRFEGPLAAARHRAEQTRLLWRSFGEPELWEGEDALAWWAALRDAAPLAGSTVLWRAALPPSAAPALIAAARPDRWALDRAGALAWLGYDAPGTDVRAHLPEGHATLILAPQEERAEIPALHPRPPQIRALEQRIKDAFDPAGILEPGRMG